MGDLGNKGTNKLSGLEILFRHHRQNCEHDFEYFAKSELMIDLKGGGLPQAFLLNRAQKYVLWRLLEQQDKLGFIRANILKGRQQGMSTLVAGLIFWKCSMNPCMNATLVSKDFKATKSLFDKIKRFAYTRPIDQNIQVSTCNQDELRLSNDSLIRCSTARADQVSRGSTNQLLFLSEAPYWENGSARSRRYLDNYEDIRPYLVDDLIDLEDKYLKNMHSSAGMIECFGDEDAERYIDIIVSDYRTNVERIANSGKDAETITKETANLKRKTKNGLRALEAAINHVKGYGSVSWNELGNDSISGPSGWYNV